MGIRTDIRDEICKETVTKIHGQPTSHDLTNLEKEIILILAIIPTTLGIDGKLLLDFIITYVCTEVTYDSQTSNYWRFTIFKSPAKGLH